AARAVGRVDLREPEAPSEYRLHVALLARLGPGTLHVGGHARVAGEIALDVVARRIPFDAEVRRQAEGAHAVDEPEVDHLRVAALLARHLLERRAEDLRGGGAMHVESLREGAEQALV